MIEKIYCKSGGCSAKLGAKKLSHILEKIESFKDENVLVGFDSRDDAAVYQIDESHAFVSTLDFFPPMVEDPYLYGQIAATNALHPPLLQYIFSIIKNSPLLYTHTKHLVLLKIFSIFPHLNL